MGTLTIIGWVLLCISWFPKPFIKNEQKRRLTNMILSGISVVVFTISIIISLTK